MAFLFSARAVAADPPGLILTAAEAAREGAPRLCKARLPSEAAASFFFTRARPER